MSNKPSPAVESIAPSAEVIIEEAATVDPLARLRDLFSGVTFLPPAKPEPFTFSNGTKRTPLADVLFDMGHSGLVFSGAQIVDEQSPRRGRSVQLRMPNKGKVGGYDPLLIAESERDKAAYIQWHKETVAKWAQWRLACVKAGTTVKPSEIKADAVVYSDADLIALGLLEEGAGAPAK